MSYDNFLPTRRKTVKSNKKENVMHRAIIYLRVSTIKQVKEGCSLAAQETKARAWAAAHDFSECIVFHDDGISGSSTDTRAGLSSALEKVGKGDALIVYSLSRLARSTKDTLAIADLLAKKSADLISLSENIDTTSACGKMIFQLLAVLAEFEKNQVRERTALGMAHLKSINRRTSKSAPYGFRFASAGFKQNTNPPQEIFTVEPDIGEATIVMLARNLRASGLPLRKVSRELEKLGIFNRNGMPFSSSTLSDVCIAIGQAEQKQEATI